MFLPGLYVSPEYSVKFPHSMKSIDIYWYNIPIGSVSRVYLNAGWSDWKWCSGSTIGDKMNVPDDTYLIKIKAKAISEVQRAIL